LWRLQDVAVKTPAEMFLQTETDRNRLLKQLTEEELNELLRKRGIKFEE